MYFHWLGKAQGRRAETASPFTAPSYASKARQAFEKSVELDGKNLEAINDLFSYYLEAPGFLGGGLNKELKRWRSELRQSIPSSTTTRWLRLRTSGRITTRRNPTSGERLNWLHAR